MPAVPGKVVVRDLPQLVQHTLHILPTYPAWSEWWHLHGKRHLRHCCSVLASRVLPEPAVQRAACGAVNGMAEC